MSDIVLKILPDEPTFVPESEAQLVVYDLLKTVTGSNESSISIVNLPEVEFQDAGGIDMLIQCPFCNADLSTDWWAESVDKAWVSPPGFVNLATVSPCCSEAVSLNDLVYNPQVGFSKFLYEIGNPIHTPNEEQMNQFQSLLGCKLRTVVARY